MKKLFTAIRQKNLDEVIAIINKNPKLVNCVAKQPPKKDDGQSPLQVAFKTMNFDAAKFLIDNGANVNFIEKESINEWKAPVIHDAIGALIYQVRFGIYIPAFSNKNTTGFLGLFKKDQYKIDSKDRYFYDKAFELLKLLIEKGADVNAVDSYGIDCLERLCLRINEHWINYPEPFFEETIEELSPILQLFIDSGVNIHRKAKSDWAIDGNEYNIINQLITK